MNRVYRLIGVILIVKGGSPGWLLGKDATMHHLGDVSATVKQGGVVYDSIFKYPVKNK